MDFAIEDIEPDCVFVTWMLYIGKPDFPALEYEGGLFDPDLYAVFMNKNVPVWCHSSVEARDILKCLGLTDDEIETKINIARYGPT